MMRQERCGLTESEKCMWLAEIDSELYLKKPGLPVLENAVIKALKSTKRTNKMEKVKPLLFRNLTKE